MIRDWSVPGVILVVSPHSWCDGYDLAGQTDNSYISARIRVGYNWLNWDNENPQLLGNMFYFAVGINLFSHTIK